MRNGHLMELANAKQVVIPGTSIAADATSERVSMVGNKSVAFIIQLPAGAATTFTMEVKQANAASAGTVKALAIANKYYHKAGAATVFTQVEPTVEADTLAVTALDTAAGVLVVEVNDTDLDVNNGFTHAHIVIKAAGAARTATVLAVAHNTTTLPGYNVAI